MNERIADWLRNLWRKRILRQPGLCPCGRYRGHLKICSFLYKRGYREKIVLKSSPPIKVESVRVVIVPKGMDNIEVDVEDCLAYLVTEMDYTEPDEDGERKPLTYRLSLNVTKAK